MFHHHRSHCDPTRNSHDVELGTRGALARPRAAEASWENEGGRLLRDAAFENSTPPCARARTNADPTSRHRAASEHMAERTWT